MQEAQLLEETGLFLTRLFQQDTARSPTVCLIAVAAAALVAAAVAAGVAAGAGFAAIVVAVFFEGLLGVNDAQTGLAGTLHLRNGGHRDSLHPKDEYVFMGSC